VLGGEVVERGERVPVLVELRDRLGVLGVELTAEPLQRLAGVRPRWRLGDLVQQALRPWLEPLGERVEDVRCLVNLMPTSA
jgi:hypothetical protein